MVIVAFYEALVVSFAGFPPAREWRRGGLGMMKGKRVWGAVKATNVQQMVSRGDGVYYVFLNKVLETMRETGADMQTKYKETSRGGLAVNVIEC